VTLLADPRGFTYRDIGEHLNLSEATVKVYTEQIANQIESDLPAKARVIVWERLRNRCDVFTGKPLPMRQEA
jgi:FixJ family two-component response regulator